MAVAAIAAFLAFGRPAAGAIFNDVLPGARPMGMGMAYTAVADDPYALFYNPAGTAGNDFPQLNTSIGRMFSPLGPLSEFALAYSRPFPLRPYGSNVGAGFFHLREVGGDKDEFLFHYSEPMKIPDIYEMTFNRPIKVGGNIKILSVDASKGSKVGLGADAGAIVDSGFGLKGGMAVTDLTSDVGAPNPTIHMGTAYLFRNWLTLASDLRIRPRLTEFYPGLEASFYQGLLKARIGKGLQLNGVGQVAFGFGFNFSPVVIDYAMTVPWAGFNRSGGAYQMSLGYRFGAPPFYGRFVGAAARQAEDLRSELAVLEDKKKSLDTQTAAAQANREAAEGRLRAIETRAQTLQDELRALDRKLEEKRFENLKPRPQAMPEEPAPKPKPPTWPQRHRVAQGDTLRSLAAKYYGDANLWELIYKANRDKVDRGLPQEGAVLAIPAPTK